MKPFNIMAVVFLVLLGTFVVMTLERLKLQDSRIFRLEERIQELEWNARESEGKTPHTDWRPEIEHAL